jgi:hypothetical protein
MMSDNYFQQKPETAIRSWILYNMLIGAGWAAAFVLSVGALLLAIWGVGLLLPEESKQAPSPMGMIDRPAVTALA